ncbi:MAG: response regulator transcription factor [Candidatus Riflebacteria bacterium]|nr:response regulator transcription factor [Candidatus Riflebacteria bacterium]
MLACARFVELAGSTGSVEEATRLLARPRPPDAVLIGTDMGREQLDTLLSVLPSGVRLLALVRSDDPAHIAAALRFPALGFLLESALTTDALGDAILRVRSGEFVVSPALAAHFLGAARRGTDPVRRHAMADLTGREGQVLRLLVMGLSNKQVARHLGISQNGVKRHVASLLAKLNAPNRTAAVARALLEKLVEAPDDAETASACDRVRTSRAPPLLAAIRSGGPAVERVLT